MRQRCNKKNTDGCTEGFCRQLDPILVCVNASLGLALHLPVCTFVYILLSCAILALDLAEV